MGLVVLPDHETCLNWQGLCCDVCNRVCQLLGKVITLEWVYNDSTKIHAKLLSTVHSDACISCRKCEQICVQEKPTTPKSAVTATTLRIWTSRNKKRLQPVCMRWQRKRVKPVSTATKGLRTICHI